MIGAATVLLAVGGATAQSPVPPGPIRLVNVTDSSAAGLRWRNGVDLALREINARGGILGRQAVLSHVDSIDAALASKPDLLLASGATPELTVPVLSAARLASDPASDGARLAAHVATTAKARSVALIWTESAATRRARDEAMKELVGRRITIATEIAAEAQRVDFSVPVLQAKNARADALVALVDEAEAPRLLRELQRQGYDKPIFGSPALVGAKALEEGVTLRAFVGLSADSPAPAIRDVARAYERAYGAKADATSLLGYSGLYVIKVVMDRAGQADGDAFLRVLKGAQISATEQPGVLLDVRFDENGQAHRGALVVESRAGRLDVVDILPP